MTDKAQGAAAAEEQWIFDLVAQHELPGAGLWGNPTFSSTGIVDFVRAALKAQPAPTDPYQLDDDDEARFPNDTNVVILRKDRYWKLRGCEDVCAALDAKPAPTEAPITFQDVQDAARLAWSVALDDAAFYVAGHCANGEFHAEAISTMRMPAIKFRGEEAPTEAQGEDSARLDAERYRWMRVLANHFMLATSARWNTPEQLDAIIDRARASVETGGVKS